MEVYDLMNPIIVACQLCQVSRQGALQDNAINSLEQQDFVTKQFDRLFVFKARPKFRHHCTRVCKAEEVGRTKDSALPVTSDGSFIELNWCCCRYCYRYHYPCLRLRRRCHCCCCCFCCCCCCCCCRRCCPNRCCCCFCHCCRCCWCCCCSSFFRSFVILLFDVRLLWMFVWIS